MADQVPLPKPDPRKSYYGEDMDFPVGPLKGQLHLLPQFNDLGNVRPMGPGEYIDYRGQPPLPGNPSWDSEQTYTVQHGNQWMVVPGLWLKNGQAHHVDEEEALSNALATGLVFPSFGSQQEADKFTEEREKAWEPVPFGKSDAQPPLWSRRWPPAR